MKYTSIDYQPGMQKRYNFKIQEYSNIAELVSHLEEATKAEEYNRNFTSRYARSSEDRHNDGWSGADTYGKALELLTSGWLPEAEKLSKKLPVSTLSSNVASKSPCYSTVGFQASVPRYLQGIPTNMINHKIVAQKQKIVVLDRSISFSARWSSDKILEEGIKALQVIQALEGKGYRVKMNVFLASEESAFTTEVAVCKVCVKSPDERLNLSKIAFPIAHPAFLRRILFRWIETFQELEKDFSSSYGKPSYMYKEVAPKNEFIMPAEIGNIEGYVKSLNV